MAQPVPVPSTQQTSSLACPAPLLLTFQRQLQNSAQSSAPSAPVAPVAPSAPSAPLASLAASASPAPSAPLALPAPPSAPPILLFYRPQSAANGAVPIADGAPVELAPETESEDTDEPVILVGYFGAAAEPGEAVSGPEPAAERPFPKLETTDEEDPRLTLLERLELRQDEVIRELDALDLRITKLITELSALRQRTGPDAPSVAAVTDPKPSGRSTRSANSAAAVAAQVSERA